MSTYLPYNYSINKHLLDWKKYDLSEPTLNQRKFLNLQVNLSESTMMGTEHSSESAGYVTTRF